MSHKSDALTNICTPPFPRANTSTTKVWIEALFEPMGQCLGYYLRAKTMALPTNIFYAGRHTQPTETAGTNIVDTYENSRPGCSCSKAAQLLALATETEEPNVLWVLWLRRTVVRSASGNQNCNGDAHWGNLQFGNETSENGATIYTFWFGWALVCAHTLWVNFFVQTICWLAGSLG